MEDIKTTAAERLKQKNKEFSKRIGLDRTNFEREMGERLAITPLKTFANKVDFNTLLSDTLKSLESVYNDLVSKKMLKTEESFGDFSKSFLVKFDDYVVEHPDKFNNNRSQKFDPKIKYDGLENLFLAYDNIADIKRSFKEIAKDMIVKIDDNKDNEFDVKDAINKISNTLDNTLLLAEVKYANDRDDSFANYLALELTTKFGTQVKAIPNKDYVPEEGKPIDFSKAYEFGVQVGSDAKNTLKAKDEKAYEQYMDYIKKCLVNNDTTLTDEEKERNAALYDGLIDDFIKQTIYASQVNIKDDIKKQTINDYMTKYVNEHMTEFTSESKDMADLVQGNQNNKIAPVDIELFNKIKNDYLASEEYATTYKAAKETYDQKIIELIKELSVKVDAKSVDKYGIELGSISGNINKDSYNIMIEGKSLRDIVTEKLKKLNPLLESADVSKKIELTKDNGMIYKQFMTSLSYAEDKFFIPTYIKHILENDTKMTHNAAHKVMGVMQQERANKDLVMNGKYGDSNEQAKLAFESTMSKIAENMGLKPEDCSVYTMNKDAFAKDKNIFVGYRDDLAGSCNNLALVYAMSMHKQMTTDQIETAAATKNLEYNTVEFVQEMYSRQANYDSLKQVSLEVIKEAQNAPSDMVGEADKQSAIANAYSTTATYAMETKKIISDKKKNELDTFITYTDLANSNAKYLNQSEMFTNKLKWTEALNATKEISKNSADHYRKALHKYFETANTEDIELFFDRVSKKVLRIDLNTKTTAQTDKTKNALEKKTLRDATNNCMSSILKSMQMDNVMTKEIDTIIAEFKDEKSWTLFLAENPDLALQYTERRKELEEKGEIEPLTKDEEKVEDVEDIRMRDFSFNRKELHMIAEAFRKKHLVLGKTKSAEERILDKRVSEIKKLSVKVADKQNKGLQLEPLYSKKLAQRSDKKRDDYSPMYQNIDFDDMLQFNQNLYDTMQSKVKLDDFDKNINGKKENEINEILDNMSGGNTESIFEYTKGLIYTLNLLKKNIVYKKKYLENEDITFDDMVSVATSGVPFEKEGVDQKTFLSDYEIIREKLEKAESNLSFSTGGVSQHARVKYCMELVQSIKGLQGEGHILGDVAEHYSVGLINTNTLSKTTPYAYSVKGNIDLTKKGTRICDVTNRTQVCEHYVVPEFETTKVIDTTNLDEDTKKKAQMFAEERSAFALNAIISKSMELKKNSSNPEYSFQNSMNNYLINGVKLDKKDYLVGFVEEYKKVEPLLTNFAKNGNGYEITRELQQAFGVSADDKEQVEKSHSSSIILNMVSNLTKRYAKTMGDIQSYYSESSPENKTKDGVEINLEDLVKDSPSESKYDDMLTKLDYIDTYAGTIKGLIASGKSIQEVMSNVANYTMPRLNEVGGPIKDTPNYSANNKMLSGLESIGNDAETIKAITESGKSIEEIQQFAKNNSLITKGKSIQEIIALMSKNAPTAGNATEKPNVNATDIEKNKDDSGRDK